MEPLLLLTTGGTFDKVYGSGKRIRDLHIGKPAAPGMLRRMGFRNFDTIQICRKDSLDLTDRNRQKTADACWKKGKGRPTVIIHGTDTMVETAEFLDVETIGISEPVFLTGALKPACTLGSDAEFNLGSAVTVACSGRYKYGIFIVMHGIVFPWNRCEKREDGTFGFIEDSA